MIKNIFITGSISGFIFLISIIILGMSGMFKHVRDEEGRFIKKWNWKTVLSFAIFILLLSGMLLLGNWRLINVSTVDPGFYKLWINSFGIFMIVHIIDLVILDFLIIIKWHPGFLNLPDTDYYTKMKPHLKGFLRGIPFGLIVSVIAAGISWYNN